MLWTAIVGHTLARSVGIYLSKKKKKSTLLRQPWIGSVSDFVYSYSAYDGGWPAPPSLLICPPTVYSSTVAQLEPIVKPDNLAKTKSHRPAH